MHPGLFKEIREFLKHSDWKIHSKNKDNSVKLYIRVSERQNLCLKSVAFANESLDDLVEALCDLNLKQKYDESYEGGHYIHSDMPYDASSQYFKSKKVMVVSSRDMALIGKQIRISAKETYLYAKSITLDSVPPVKNIVRAETPISGWRIK